MGSKTKINYRDSYEGQWNGLDVIGRKNMILSHQDLFLALGLTTQEEIDRMSATSDSDIEYLACRKADILCRKIDLSQNFDTQPLPAPFRAALKAVF